MITEAWKPIPGAQEPIEVSNLGGLRFYGGPVMRWNKPDQYHYRFVRGLHTSQGVHRLVLMAFVGRPPTPTSQANHLNGIKGDNRLENLEWCTPLENMRHYFRVLRPMRPRATVRKQRLLAMPDGWSPPLRVTEVAEMLRIKPHQLYKLIEAGAFPNTFRLMRCYRMDMADVVRFKAQSLPSPSPT